MFKHLRKLATVFIGYGLKTGQGFYPGPNFLEEVKHQQIRK